MTSQDITDLSECGVRYPNTSKFVHRKWWLTDKFCGVIFFQIDPSYIERGRMTINQRRANDSSEDTYLPQSGTWLQQIKQIWGFKAWQWRCLLKRRISPTKMSVYQQALSYITSKHVNITGKTCNPTSKKTWDAISKNVNKTNTIEYGSKLNTCGATDCGLCSLNYACIFCCTQVWPLG